MNPYDLLKSRADGQPDAVAFVFEDEPCSYDELLDAVDRLARGLVAQGVAAGDRVALHMRNRPELFMGYLACFRLGAIAAPINTRLKTAEVRSLLKRLQPKVYLGQDALLPVVDDIEEEVLPYRVRFSAGRAPGRRAASWAQLLVDATGELPPGGDETALALLLTTSGTTGEPKFVAHTYASLSVILDSLDAVQVTGGGVAAVVSPAVHGLGLSVFLSAIYAGTPAIVLEQFEADVLLDAIATYAVRGLFLPPFAYAEMVERQRARPRDASSLAVCYVGGDACPPELQLAFTEAFRRPVRNVWGASEVGILRPAAGVGPVMRAAEWLAVRVVDDDGVPVAMGETGELLVRGPTVMAGYWLGPDQLLDATRDGWFPTGDLVRREGDDELSFVGRKKDLIIRGGSNIAPLEVELIIRSHPAVAEATVTGVLDDILGQRVAAVIQLTPGTPPSVVPDIIAWVRRDLADYKVPERVRVVAELPVNALGKVDRRAARLLAEDAEPVAAAGLAPEARELARDEESDVEAARPGSGRSRGPQRLSAQSATPAERPA